MTIGTYYTLKSGHIIKAVAESYDGRFIIGECLSSPGNSWVGLWDLNGYYIGAERVFDIASVLKAPNQEWVKAIDPLLRQISRLQAEVQELTEAKNFAVNQNQEFEVG